MPASIVPSGASRLWVESEGEGPPVVFLHAGVCDRRMWRDQVSALAPRFRAIAYDRRGFGRTEHADEAYSHVADLLAVLDALAPSQPAILVGCSQGGRISIDFALAFPQRVRALVLVAPAITGAPEPTGFSSTELALFDEIEQAEAAGDVDRLNALEAHAWLDGPGQRRGRVGGALRELFLDMNGIALRAGARGEQIGAPAAYDRLGDIAPPTLVVWGDHDFPYVIENCRRLAAASSGESFIVPGAAHLPNLEQPGQFNRKLLDFCAALGT